MVLSMISCCAGGHLQMWPCSQMIMQASAESGLRASLVTAFYSAAGKCYCCPEANPCRPADEALILLKGLIKLCSHLTYQSQPASSL